MIYHFHCECPDCQGDLLTAEERAEVELMRKSVDGETAFHPWPIVAIIDRLAPNPDVPDAPLDANRRPLRAYLRDWLTIFADQQQRWADSARVLAEREPSWMICAQHCEGRANAARRMLADLDIVCEYDGIKSLAVGITPAMLEAHDGAYLAPGALGKELYYIVKSVFGAYPGLDTMTLRPLLGRSCRNLAGRRPRWINCLRGLIEFSTGRPLANS